MVQGPEANPECGINNQAQCITATAIGSVLVSKQN